MTYFYNALNYKQFNFFWIPINALDNMVKNPLAAPQIPSNSQSQKGFLFLR